MRGDEGLAMDDSNGEGKRKSQVINQEVELIGFVVKILCGGSGKKELKEASLRIEMWTKIGMTLTFVEALVK